MKHVCPPDGIGLRSKVKASASISKSSSAMNIVEASILDSNIDNHVPNPNLLARMIYRARKKERPNEPKTIDCPILPSFVLVPNEFLLFNVKIEDEKGLAEAKICCQHQQTK